MGNVDLTWSNIPPAFCALTQEDVNTLFGLLAGNVVSPGQFFKGDSAPTDLAQTWHRTINGKPDRDYDYVSGAWHAPHWATEGTVIMWEGDLADIPKFETPTGQDAEVIGWDTGPFWEEVEEMRGRSPMGPGTLPSGLVVAVTDQKGDEKVALTIEEMPSHHHALLVADSNTGGGNDVQRLRPDSTLSESDANSALAGGDPANANATKPHNTIHPVYGIFALRKTARTHHRI